MFRRTRIPARPLCRGDERLGPCGMFFRFERKRNDVPQLGFGIRADAHPAGARSTPPRIGMHSEDVLRVESNDNLRQIDKPTATGTM